MSAAPVLLGFDTSTEQLAVVLLDAAGAVHAINAPGGAAASAALLPAIHGLLARAALPLQAVQAIAYGQGPGAFTGLRTSCAVAQGLAFGLGCPLLPVDSLLLVAEDARMQAGVDAAAPFDVAVAMDARIEEAYAARYRHDGNAWTALQAPALMTLPALAASVQADAPAWRAGSAWVVYSSRLPTHDAARQVGVEHDRAAALGRLTLAAWRAGAAIDPALALPLYLRDKVALTTDERAAVKNAQVSARP